ncbi:MAG: FHA domain-containing protein [Chloroflexota bacterium]|nr:FHA domain-containing protein [Chloroflexota bacterium]
MVEPTRVLTRTFGAVAWLVAASGRRAGRDTRLGRSTSIGRDGLRNDIVLDDSAVSATHAKIRLERGRFVLYDLGSTNGTLVNRRRVQKHTLVDGDEILVGRSAFVFKEVRR